jgi:hypothetical protein
MPFISQITVRPHHMYPLSQLIGPNKATEKVHPGCGGQMGRAGAAHFQHEEQTMECFYHSWRRRTEGGGIRSHPSISHHRRPPPQTDGGTGWRPKSLEPSRGLEVEEGAALPCLRLLHQRVPPSSCSTGPLPQVPPLTGTALLAAARAATR